MKNSPFIFIFFSQAEIGFYTLYRQIFCMQIFSITTTRLSGEQMETYLTLFICNGYALLCPVFLLYIYISSLSLSCIVYVNVNVNVVTLLLLSPACSLYGFNIKDCFCFFTLSSCTLLHPHVTLSHMLHKRSQ